jgi:chorismate dehydratase
MKSKLRLAVVSFLNTKPFVWGLQNHSISSQLQIATATPVEIGEMLKNNSADVGLVPVAMLNDIPSASIFSDYCIGCNGPVESVKIFSHVSIQEAETLLLDERSRTSQKLAQVICRKFWNISPAYRSSGNVVSGISKQTAGLLIGDEALRMHQAFPFQYDLGDVWKQMTGLPFVFAVWVSIRELNNPWPLLFNEAFSWGISHVANVCEEEKEKFEGIDISQYLRNNISYQLTDQKREAMSLFLEWIGEAHNVHA